MWRCSRPPARPAASRPPAADSPSGVFRSRTTCPRISVRPSRRTETGSCGSARRAGWCATTACVPRLPLRPRRSRTLWPASYVRALLAASDGRSGPARSAAGCRSSIPPTEAFSRYRARSARTRDASRTTASKGWPKTAPVASGSPPTKGSIASTRRSGASIISAHDPADADQSRRRPHARAAGRPRADGCGWAAATVCRSGARPGASSASLDPLDRVARRPVRGEALSRTRADGSGSAPTEHGAAVLDPRTGQLAASPPRPSADGLSHFWVYGFARQRPGEIWIATFGGGVDVVDPRLAAGHRPPAARSGAARHHRAATASARCCATGRAWSGWAPGARGSRATIPRRAPSGRSATAPTSPDGLTHPAAVRSLELRDGTIWVGTNGNGIDILDRRSAPRSAAIARDPPGSAARCPTARSPAWREAPDGTVWVATLNGILHRLRPGATRFERPTPARRTAGRSDPRPDRSGRTASCGPAPRKAWRASTRCRDTHHVLPPPARRRQPLSGCAVEAIAVRPRRHALGRHRQRPQRVRSRSGHGGAHRPRAGTAPTACPTTGFPI